MPEQVIRVHSRDSRANLLGEPLSTMFLMAVLSWIDSTKTAENLALPHQVVQPERSLRITTGFLTPSLSLSGKVADSSLRSPAGLLSLPAIA